MMHLEPIPAFEDNYIWAVHDGRTAIIVDPGEAAPILTWLRDRRLALAAILVTHHHRDHCGGLREILERHPAPVYGPAHERIAMVDRPVTEGTPCVVPELGLEFQVLDIPGHTSGHVAYFGNGWLFCGDTIFSCGCGRVFGGTLPDLHASLTRLAGLPPDTLVCCAHEYTLDNIRFAIQVEPDNPQLIAWRATAQALRQVGKPTLPVRLGDEIERNPFLRPHIETVRRRVETLAGHALPSDPALVFAAMRQAKDRQD